MKLSNSYKSNSKLEGLSKLYKSAAQIHDSLIKLMNDFKKDFKDCEYFENISGVELNSPCIIMRLYKKKISIKLEITTNFNYIEGTFEVVIGVFRKHGGCSTSEFIYITTDTIDLRLCTLYECLDNFKNRINEI